MAAFSSRLVTLLLIVLLSCFVDRCCSPQCCAYRQEQYVSDYCYELSLEGVLLEPFSCRVSSGWAWQLTYLTAPGGRQFVLTPAWSGGSDQLFTPPYRVASQLFYVRLCLLWSRPYSSVPFRPRPRSSISCVICSLLLLISCGDVELNPGPVNPIKVCQVASYNICSAVGKAASVHDILADFNLDILALSETRIKVADPPAIKNSVAPEGYILSSPRSPQSVEQSSVRRRARRHLPELACRQTAFAMLDAVAGDIRTAAGDRVDVTCAHHRERLSSATDVGRRVHRRAGRSSVDADECR